MEILILYIFCTVVTFTTLLIALTIEKIRAWYSNKNKPVISAHAKVTSRRTYNHKGLDITLYFATFKIENGKQIEFQMIEADYMLLNEGDFGVLKFRGTYYKGFQPLGCEK